MLKITILLILLLTLPIIGMAQTCEQVFAISAKIVLPESLLNKTSVSDWKILKAAQADIIGDRSLTQKARDKFLSFFEMFRTNQNYREQIEIEIRRRDFEAALEKMGVQTHSDPRYWLRNHKHYFSTLFSIAANGGINYLSYHFLGHAGFLVHLPKTRFFKPEEIPDAVIAELLASDTIQPRVRQYVMTRVSHGADLVLNNIRKYFNIGILASFAVLHGDMLMDPQNYLNNQLTHSSEAITNYALQSNLELKAKLEIKKEHFEKSGQLENAAAAEKIIKQIENQNKQLIEHNSGERK